MDDLDELHTMNVDLVPDLDVTQVLEPACKKRKKDDVTKEMMDELLC